MLVFFFQLVWYGTTSFRLTFTICDTFNWSQMSSVMIVSTSKSDLNLISKVEWWSFCCLLAACFCQVSDIKLICDRFKVTIISPCIIHRNSEFAFFFNSCSFPLKKNEIKSNCVSWVMLLYAIKWYLLIL